VCRIRKLFRRDFSTNYQSTVPMVKMTNRKIKLGIDWVLKRAKPLMRWPKQQKHATNDNALDILKIAEQEATEVNGLIQTINTDRGSQFYPNKKDKNGEEYSVFRDYLESKGILHIPSRRNNPQANGKIEI